MFRRITVGLLLLLSGVVLAQEGTTSPYSYYGIGTLKFRGTVENRAMAGLGIFADSIHLNLQNPAGYSELGLVTLSGAVSRQMSIQKTAAESHRTSTTSLDYFSLGIPMGKFGLGFGVLPFSSVGYNFFAERPDGITEYKGEGGLNKTYLSLAYKISPRLSFGIDGHYNFGNIESRTISQQEELQYGIRTLDNSQIGGFSINFGVIYQAPITKDISLTGSATYMPGMDLNSKNTREISTVSIRPSGIQTIDKRDVDIPDTDFSYPTQFSLGAGLSRNHHWGVGLEYTNRKWSEISNQAYSDQRVDYKDAFSLSLGGYFIPEYNSFTNYYKRVVYRAGIRYEQTGMSFNNEDVNEFGISFGMGLPIGRLFSNINLGIELGKRGTKNHGLIQENFFNAFLSFSLNDRWFEKRLYN